MIALILLVLASYMYKQGKPAAKHVESAANSLFKVVLACAATLWCISCVIDAQCAAYSTQLAVFASSTPMSGGHIADMDPMLVHEYLAATKNAARWGAMQGWVLDSWVLLVIL